MDTDHTDGQHHCDGGHCHCHDDSMGMGHHMHGWTLFAAVRVLTAAIVIIFVFWCGFEFGEVRALMGSYGRDGGMMYGGGIGRHMMNGDGQYVQLSGTAATVNSAGPAQAQASTPTR